MKIVGTRVVIVRIQDEATPGQADMVLKEVFESLSRWRATEATGLEQVFEPRGLSVQIMDLIDGVTDPPLADVKPDVIIVSIDPLPGEDPDPDPDPVQVAESEDADEVEEEQDVPDGKTADGSSGPVETATSDAPKDKVEPQVSGGAEGTVQSDGGHLNPDQGGDVLPTLRGKPLASPSDSPSAPPVTPPSTNPWTVSAAKAGREDGVVE